MSMTMRTACASKPAAKAAAALHRADRMRTGRPDTDFENIKNADHGFAPKGGFRRHGFRLTNQKETRHDARLLF